MGGTPNFVPPPPFPGRNSQKGEEDKRKEASMTEDPRRGRSKEEKGDGGAEMDISCPCISVVSLVLGFNLDKSSSQN